MLPSAILMGQHQGLSPPWEHMAGLASLLLTQTQGKAPWVLPVCELPRGEALLHASCAVLHAHSISTSAEDTCPALDGMGLTSFLAATAMQL